MSDKITKKELYERCDQSGLFRQAFYLQMVGETELKEIVEVGSI
jgi:hypothetical protein